MSKPASNDYFNTIKTYRMRDRCFTKCMVEFREAHLTEADSRCAERCILKYWEVQKKVSEKFAQQMQNQ
jgi:import inner membrane translocase subunit TIM10